MLEHVGARTMAVHRERERVSHEEVRLAFVLNGEVDRAELGVRDAEVHVVAAADGEYVAIERDDARRAGTVEHDEVG
ncbi:MAG: hypothetical protein U0235_21685 [Polyangiaceae bacterium]